MAVHLSFKFIRTLGRVLKPTEVYLLPPFRPLLRHFSLTCPGTPAENFLAWNENSAKSASFRVFRHTLKKITRGLVSGSPQFVNFFAALNP